MPTLGKNKYLRISEVEKLLGINRSAVRRYTNAGILKCVINPFNHYRLYRQKEINKLLKKIKIAEKKAGL